MSDIKEQLKELAEGHGKWGTLVFSTDTLTNFINQNYISRKEVEEAIGDYVVEDPRNIPEWQDVAYDYGVCRRNGANNLRKELKQKFNLEGR